MYGINSAMDTTIAFAKQKTGNTIDRYAVAGASKRGWTTWLTAAVDKRVMAMVLASPSACICPLEQY
jgi:PhoPQ-activated pathogenicity-related protein